MVSGRRSGSGREPMDKVEWEIVRADIAMEKARLKANGDWAKWEEFQTLRAFTPCEHRPNMAGRRRCARSIRHVPFGESCGASVGAFLRSCLRRRVSEEPPRRPCANFRRRLFVGRLHGEPDSRRP